MTNQAKRPQVLLVEDEEPIRELWIEELQDAHYAVSGAAGAAAALAVLAATRLDAAIIDIGLPEMSGVTLIAAARVIDPHLPILAVTGFDARHFSELSDHGITVLQKPFRTSWLLFNLNTLLARRAYQLQAMSAAGLSAA